MLRNCACTPCGDILRETHEGKNIVEQCKRDQHKGEPVRVVPREEGNILLRRVVGGRITVGVTDFRPYFKFRWTVDYRLAVYLLHLRRHRGQHWERDVSRVPEDFQAFPSNGWRPSHNISGGHIGFTNGESWKNRRRFALLTLRNFGMGKKSIEERILEEVQFLIKEFENTKQSPVDLTIFLARAVSNVICSIIYGNRFDYEDKRLLAITASIYNNFCVMSSTWGTLYNMFPNLMDYLPGPHKKIWRNFQDIYDISADLIENHEKTLDPKNPRDYIDCFLIKIKQEADIPDTSFYIKSLPRTIQNLLFGGTETVSTTLRYGILILMKYPEIAERIQKEIDNVVGRDRSPSIADRSKMPYTEATIHEFMRFCDVIPISLPRSTSTNTVFRGFSIPKGTLITPLLTSVHYDPEYYTEPNMFNPNNFLDEKGLFKKNDAHMPFAAANLSRESLARMELFLFFTSLLQNFTFKPMVSKEELDIRPTASGLGSVPPEYKCCILPR
ncbi:unnamed protein product [Ranitomeya imitator]|uniref:Cytochrome P450 n=1 Tax=Ranitomeya imitator TaxID=111125 RepID=A0ABN9LPN9_9NEOB|nr:unnamed protein product [Ranitomeya imitator]